MAEDDNSWVFDSLVCFLNGPIWDAPIQSFIEEKSLIFDPNDGENEVEYQKIFDEYKNLVDFMLGNFMEDIGITPTQFEYACSKGYEHRHSVRFDHNIFQQIWAANNYEMFKRMMAQKNVELQLQALELIEQKFGIMPQSFIPSKKQTSAQIENEAQEVETVEMKADIEKTVLSEVAKIFPEDNPREVPEIDFILEEKVILEGAMDKLSVEVNKVEGPGNDEKFEACNNNESSGSSSKTAENQKIQSTQPVNLQTKEIKITGIEKIDQVALKKRQEYLRNQRDKLVAMKKEERKKQFGKTDQSSIKSARPKSAKAASAVLTGQTLSLPSQELQIRKALAERLKAEVVNRASE